MLDSFQFSHGSMLRTSHSLQILLFWKHHLSYCLLQERQLKYLKFSLLERTQRCHLQAKNKEVLLMKCQSESLESRGSSLVTLSYHFRTFPQSVLLKFITVWETSENLSEGYSCFYTCQVIYCRIVCNKQQRLETIQAFINRGVVKLWRILQCNTIQLFKRMRKFCSNW